jgi:hypothetical protein
MSEKDPKRPNAEIVSLNEELMSCDVNDVSVEELERRFELSLIPILPPGGDECIVHFAPCGIN